MDNAPAVSAEPHSRSADSRSARRRGGRLVRRTSVLVLVSALAITATVWLRLPDTSLQVAVEDAGGRYHDFRPVGLLPALMSSATGVSTRQHRVRFAPSLSHHVDDDRGLRTAAQPLHTCLPHRTVVICPKLRLSCRVGRIQ